MKKSTKTLIWGISSIMLTMAVGMIDVKRVKETNTKIGFATLNQGVFDFFGVNEIWDKITNILLIVMIGIMAVVVFWGLIRWAKEGKDAKKVGDGLAGFALAAGLMAIVYLVFEKLWIINYRPILIDGMKDISFPSTHVLIAVVFGISAAMLLCRLIKNRTIRVIINTALPTMVAWMVVGRVMTGLHWTTDVFGGLCYGMTIISVYQWLLEVRK